jgi:hypothetical protein
MEMNAAVVQPPLKHGRVKVKCVSKVFLEKLVEFLPLRQNRNGPLDRPF